jgi:glyoxylase-like metal-dependent hydrolase (beta-lactamase superfamily II)
VGRPFSNGCLAAAVCLSLGGRGAPASEGLTSYWKAREVLDEGLAAIGGVDALRAAGAVRREMSGDWFGSGQGARPERFVGPTLTPPALNGRERLMSFVDVQGGRFLDELQESDLTGDSVLRVTALTGDGGFETVTYRDERPFYRPFPAQDLAALRVRKSRRHPEGLLLLALDRPDTLQWVGTGRDSGRIQDVISFADPVGTRVLLYFDADTKLLAGSETLRVHSIAGDSSSEVVYDDYRPVATLRLPFHYVDRVAGVPTEEWHASAIELNATVSEERLRPPRDFARTVEDPSEPTLQRLGEGLYLIRGPYNSVFVVFRDAVVVFEAPLSSRYSQTCLDLVRRTAPGKPIRYLVSTHFHFDHVGGIRPYVADGVPILTTPDAQAVIERVAAARHTLQPDTLSRSPKEPRIETVVDRRILDDGTNRAEIYALGPTGHAAQMLVVYFPRERLLFEADVWDVTSTELAIAGADTVALVRRIRELGLAVERIVPVHGAPGTIKMLNEALAVRRKYFADAGGPLAGSVRSTRPGGTQ